MTLALPSKTEGSGAVCHRLPDGRGSGADRKGVVAGRGVKAGDTNPETTSPISLDELTDSASDSN